MQDETVNMISNAVFVVFSPLWLKKLLIPILTSLSLSCTTFAIDPTIDGLLETSDSSCLKSSISVTEVPTKVNLILSITMWQRIIANEIEICQRNHTSINLMYDVLGRSELM